jgi:hypothetical protein
MIVPAGTYAEQRTGPVTCQKNAGMKFVGIDMQLSCESIDVAFDRARRHSYAHGHFSVIEALGQQIQNFDFSRRHVNRKRPSLRWTARWYGAFSRSPHGLQS